MYLQSVNLEWQSAPSELEYTYKHAVFNCSRVGGYYRYYNLDTVLMYIIFFTLRGLVCLKPDLQLRPHIPAPCDSTSSTLSYTLRMPIVQASRIKSRRMQGAKCNKQSTVQILAGAAINWQ